VARARSNHHIDGSALLISKSRARRAVATLYVLLETHRHEMYANLYGDKEVFWLACELVGNLTCGVSPLAPLVRK
jgi:hypothetical protein